MNALYSTVILPLFNKSVPIDEGELKQKVIQFATSIGFSIRNIYLIDGSKRTTKANAFFTGFGSKKRIFLYDNLIHNLSNDEIVAVVAHELGHYKKRHVWMNLTVGLIQSAIFLYLFNLVSQNIEFTKAMSVDSKIPVFYLNLLCFILLVEPIQIILNIFTNSLIRRMEFAADRFASDYNYGKELISALTKLSSLNFSNLTPHPFYVIVNYSHPTLFDRIKAILSHNIKVQ